MVPIAIDAMGGDNAPRAVIEGAGLALERYSSIRKLLLVGAEDEIRAELSACGIQDNRLEIVHTDQVIGMHEPPAAAIRSKPASSIAVAVDLVKAGRAGSVISAGHTGAAVACTVLKLRTLRGIERPGIATVFPTPSGSFLLLDAGATVNCKAKHLAQYAIMGEIYSREILGVTAPRVGLLNVGSEDGKGNELAKSAFKQIAALPGINFIGNIEGSDLFGGNVDVVVCDGFVGNVVLKSCESLAGAIGQFLKTLLNKTAARQLGAFLCRNAFQEFKELSDYAEYGGAPLLGVNGICIIGHGSSSPIAIRNAIRVAVEALEDRLNDHIVEKVAALMPGNDTTPEANCCAEPAEAKGSQEG